MSKQISVLFVLLLLFGAAAKADLIYTGQLLGGAGIDGTGAWANDTGDADWFAPSLSWVISLNQDNTWHYEYTFSVYNYDISHFIIEVSETFSIEDLLNPVALQGSYGSISLDSYDEGNGNPGMPGTVNGIKFDDTDGVILQLSFDSTRMPVWGDFYSKDGKAGGSQNALWNSGFAAEDPQVAAHDGAEQGHLLVPDTYTYVPEPATMLILTLGVGLTTARKRLKA
ncbi:MAG: PEP-CTERM sorting domain-containing protein [Sedimentisphaerales bacterium]|nr:PEP-CTERM sorting domain-containing protein [Sedimentisphaerales bacterium]